MTRRNSTPAGRAARWTSLALVAAVAAPLAACGGDGGSTVALAEATVIAAEAAPDTTVDTTVVDDPMLVAPSTTALPPTTAVETLPATTAPPTVVQTLPTPLPPPEPRADEPYVEVGRLQIPRIGIDTVMLSGITLTTLDLGPGHWPGTAVPGQIGNVVVAGHRTSHNKVFRDIDQLQPGDEVIFTTVDGEFVYRVSETTIVQPDAMYIIDQTWEPTATLFACHPPGSTRERIVVHLDLDTEASTVASTTTDASA
ncbi:MAG: class E sortase [Acidimicrobiales bacterium]|nr:class E sortase [Acidimicrobiales bacterium]MCB9396111.1 class E sortase [Acidimicrobiaceae bacterium]